jgi:hypothetical protein
MPDGDTVELAVDAARLTVTVANVATAEPTTPKLSHRALREPEREEARPPIRALSNPCYFCFFSFGQQYTL